MADFREFSKFRQKITKLSSLVDPDWARGATNARTVTSPLRLKSIPLCQAYAGSELESSLTALWKHFSSRNRCRKGAGCRSVSSFCHYPPLSLFFFFRFSLSRSCRLRSSSNFERTRLRVQVSGLPGREGSGSRFSNSVVVREGL